MPKLKISVRLTVELDDEREAGNLLKSLEPDNENYIYSKIEKNRLLLEGESDSILTLRSTLDDLLACLYSARQIINDSK